MSTNAQPANNNSLKLARDFLANCTSTLTANDGVRCRAISGEIAFSYKGNLARRAGALCARLGNCVGEAALASCNVSGTARLDLCTQQGYVGGQSITLATGGMYGWLALIHRALPSPFK